jgi:AraC-like DNA-binding protein
MNILALHLYHFMEYARARGIAMGDMLQLVQQPSVSFPDEKELVSEEDFYTVLAFIDEKLTDKGWGIQSARFISLKLLGLIYQISLQTTTIHEALYYLKTYMEAALPLVQANTQLSEEEASVTFSIDNEHSALNRVVLEHALTVVARELTMMAGEGIAIRISSPHYTEDYPAGWQAGEHYALAFEPVILKAALQNHSHLQIDILVPEYLKMITQLTGDDSFSGRVKVTLLSMSDPGLPDIQTLSEALYLTPRTLQRKLSAEGTTFRELLENVKKQICAMLLRHERYSVAGIATVLGYSEPASFIHSFQKWFGSSPDRMRAVFRA